MRTALPFRFLPWSMHPDRDDAWYHAQSLDMEPWQLHQEYPTTPGEAFIQSGRPVFSANYLDAHEQRILRDPLCQALRGPTDGLECVGNSGKWASLPHRRGRGGGPGYRATSTRPACSMSRRCARWRRCAANGHPNLCPQTRAAGRAIWLPVTCGGAQQPWPRVHLETQRPRLSQSLPSHAAPARGSPSAAAHRRMANDAHHQATDARLAGCGITRRHVPASRCHLSCRKPASSVTPTMAAWKRHRVSTTIPSWPTPSPSTWRSNPMSPCKPCGSSKTWPRGGEPCPASPELPLHLSRRRNSPRPSCH